MRVGDSGWRIGDSKSRDLKAMHSHASCVPHEGAALWTIPCPLCPIRFEKV